MRACIHRTLFSRLRFYFALYGESNKWTGNCNARTSQHKMCCNDDCVDDYQSTAHQNRQRSQSHSIYYLSTLYDLLRFSYISIQWFINCVFFVCNFDQIVCIVITHTHIEILFSSYALSFLVLTFNPIRLLFDSV